MSRTVYVNGHYVPEAEARLSIFDRAILFADAVYEVTAVLDGGALRGSSASCSTSRAPPRRSDA